MDKEWTEAERLIVAWRNHPSDSTRRNMMECADKLIAAAEPKIMGAEAAVGAFFAVRGSCETSIKALHSAILDNIATVLDKKFRDAGYHSGHSAFGIVAEALAVKP